MKKPKLKLVHSQPILSSDPTPERLLRSGGHFEEGKDGRGAKILTFKDYPLAVLYRSGQLHWDRDKARKLFEAGEEHYEVWHRAGLSGRLLKAIERWHPEFVPSWSDGVGHEPGMPADDTEAYFRARYRDRVQKMGLITSNIVEWVVCWQVPVRAMAGNDNEKIILRRLKNGLKILAGG